MQAHPVLFEYALGQHSGLKGVVANISNSPLGKGTGWSTRFKMSWTPFPNGCPGVTSKLGAPQFDVFTAGWLKSEDSPLFVLAPTKPSHLQHDHMRCPVNIKYAITIKIRIYYKLL